MYLLAVGFEVDIDRGIFIHMANLWTNKTIGMVVEVL